MRVEPIPGSLVKAFWDKLWELLTKPVSGLGGLGCFIVLLSIATMLALVYRAVPSARRIIHAVLVAMWIAIAVSLIMIAVGGG